VAQRAARDSAFRTFWHGVSRINAPAILADAFFALAVAYPGKNKNLDQNQKSWRIYHAFVNGFNGRGKNAACIGIC